MKNNDSSETTMRPDPDALLKEVEREESKGGRLKIFLGYAPNLYTREWRLFHNFFCPSVRLISKERKGSETIKRHDSPRTPYQRMMASSFIEPSVKEELSKQLGSLNPFVLRKGMEIKLKKIFQLCYNNDHQRSTIR